MDADRHPSDCAPYFLVAESDHYHTRLDCPAGLVAAASERRVDQRRLIERLPYW